MFDYRLLNVQTTLESTVDFLYIPNQVLTFSLLLLPTFPQPF
jgi:hypothetical protein